MARHLAHLKGPVLDLGCGAGHLSGYLASLGANVMGIDLVPEFIAHALSHYPGPKFEVGTLTSLSHGDGSVAGVLTWYSLIHMDQDELKRAFGEIRRVLMPGGILVLGFFDGVEVEGFEHKVTAAFRWPVDALADRLSEQGFEEVERLQRPQRGGERRPHAALVARTI